MNLGKAPGKKRPEESKVENEGREDQKAHPDRKIAVMGRDSGNPVDQYSIKGDTAKKSE